MDEHSLCFLPLSEQRRLLRQGAVSSRDLTAAVLRRAEDVHRSLCVFTSWRPEEALAEAEEWDSRRARGESLPELAGIPVTIKDNLDTAGIPTTNGSLIFKDRVPVRDHLPVARLRKAGVVIIGKTTLPEFANGIMTRGLLTPVSRNPWDPTRTPGGSSGGAAACVAAGVGSFTLGTDGGGSIRQPCACTGLVGLKPTLGTVPFDVADAFSNYAFCGPMTRNVPDLAFVLSLLASASDLDPYSLAAPRQSLADRPLDSLAGIRIATLASFNGATNDAEVDRAFHAAVAALADGGAEICDVTIPELDDLRETYLVIAAAAHAARFGQLLETDRDRLTPYLQESIAFRSRLSAAARQKASDRRTVAFRALQQLFRSVDYS